MFNKLSIFLLLFFLSNIANAVVFEYHPKAGYVLITEKAITSKGISPSLRQAIQAVKQPHLNIKSIAFTPDAKGWSLISKNRNQSEKMSIEYTQATQKLQAKNLSINSVAFNPLAWESKKGFVIVHNKGYIAHNIPVSLKTQLDSFNGLTQHIKIIAFTPDGGWTILSKNQEWSRMIQGQSRNFLDRVHVSYHQKRRPLAVGFNPKNYTKQFGWLLITDKGYDSLNVPKTLEDALYNAGIANLSTEDVKAKSEESSASNSKQSQEIAKN
jgi:hypothetical protein